MKKKKIKHISSWASLFKFTSCYYIQKLANLISILDHVYRSFFVNRSIIHYQLTSCHESLKKILILLSNKDMHVCIHKEEQDIQSYGLRSINDRS